jgi:endonuclease YncB( thermonuclease family)
MAKTAWMVGLALGVLLTPCPPGRAATPHLIVAKVERVHDGDTITALTPERMTLRLRLLGVAAPEIPHGKQPGQPFGEAARDYLARLIGGRTIRIETYGPDKYKRILAVAFLGEVNVNVEMVQQGLAAMSRGAPCQAYCRDLWVAELRAKRDQAGMWAEGTAYESRKAFRPRVKTRGD